jgi:hypothetical protein
MRLDATLTAALPSSGADRIIELFAKRQPAYARTDVLRLIGISDAQLDAAIANGTIQVEANDRGTSVVPWEDVAALALEDWTLRMIEAALGDDALTVIPPLNQHHVIPVALPAHLIRFVDHLARQAPARNASDIIERILHDHANIDALALDVEIPGFRQALLYPYYTHRDGASRRCRYCDLVLTGRADICRACKERHEPRRRP